MMRGTEWYCNARRWKIKKGKERRGDLLKGGQEKERRKYIHYTYIVKLGSRELSLFSATAESNFSAWERERERGREWKKDE